jgi:hypothetical protein
MQRQEEFEATLGYIGRYCLKKTQTNNIKKKEKGQETQNCMHLSTSLRYLFVIW